MKKIVLVLAVLLLSVSACKNPFLKKMLVEEGKGESSAVPKHTVTFSVEGTGGTLKAKADGVEETAKSPITVEQGKTVTFTAEPAAPYVVKEWKVDGTVVTGNTSNSYTHTVTAAVDVKVIFDAPFVEGGASLILSPDELNITVEVTTADNSPITVEGCTETTLPSGVRTMLYATGTVVILKGKIIELDCSGTYNDNNKLTALNVQGLTALQRLYCGYNQFTAFDVQGLSALQYLDCSNNRLTALDVQGCTALQELYCGYNQLTTLDVQGLSALQSLGCIANQLTALNVQDLTALQYLSCDRNQLTALDVQGLTALLKLFCSNNRFTALDVQGLSTLQYLDCDNNQLTALDVQGLSALQWLWCYNNRLTALNVQGCTALKGLECYSNQLTALNIQGCTALKGLECYSNQLTDLNVQGCTALQGLGCYSNQLTALNVQGCPALRGLDCCGNQLNDQAFTQIFSDLPTRTAGDGARCILYTEKPGVTEGNCTDFTTPAELQAAFQNAKDVKHWKMHKLNTSGDEEEI